MNISLCVLQPWRQNSTARRRTVSSRTPRRATSTGSARTAKRRWRCAVTAWHSTTPTPSSSARTATTSTTSTAETALISVPFIHSFTRLCKWADNYSGNMLMIQPDLHVCEQRPRSALATARASTVSSPTTANATSSGAAGTARLPATSAPRAWPTTASPASAPGPIRSRNAKLKVNKNLSTLSTLGDWRRHWKVNDSFKEPLTRP